MGIYYYVYAPRGRNGVVGHVPVFADELAVVLHDAPRRDADADHPAAALRTLRQQRVAHLTSYTWKKDKVLFDKQIYCTQIALIEQI